MALYVLQFDSEAEYHADWIFVGVFTSQEKADRYSEAHALDRRRNDYRGGRYAVSIEEPDPEFRVETVD